MANYNITIQTNLSDEFGIDREKARTGNAGVQTRVFLETRLQALIDGWLQDADLEAMEEIRVSYRDGNQGKKQAIRAAAGVT